jgi:protein-S-isoprenylcysteine O-methyltransferase Ste14
MSDRNHKPDVRRVDPATEDHWLTRPSTIRKLWWTLAVVLALTLVAQLFIPVKGEFALESTFGFGAWFGFLACVAMVLVARGLGWWLKRPEAYYGEGKSAKSGKEQGDA